MSFSLSFLAVLLGTLAAVNGYGNEIVCKSCSCSKWDGSDYSNCRVTTDSNPCNGYCVKCEADGVTPMPGGWMAHGEECNKYEAIAIKYESGKKGTTKCLNSENAKITTPSGCRRAAAQLGKPYKNVDNDGNYPSGCYLYENSSPEDGYYFSNHAAGKANIYSTPICQQASQGACLMSCGVKCSGNMDCIKTCADPCLAVFY